MAELTAFTRNHNDLSNESGFQFEFYCDRCNDGYRSTFKRSVSGTASSALDAASGLFGGIFGAASDVAERARQAAWGKERDAAFQAAVAEVQPLFKRCPRCTSYVCERCWNEQANLCMNCAPKLATEMEAARAQTGIDQMRQAMSAAKVFGGDLSERQTTCPQCGKPVGTEKFCSNCGAPLGFLKCPSCGHANSPSVRFCGECGTKLR